MPWPYRSTAMADHAPARDRCRCTPHRFIAFTLLLASLGLGGCAHLGEQFQAQPLPPGAPTVEAILGDLAANDEAIASFVATGSFTLKSPRIDTVYRLTESRIVYQRPASLHVLGRKYGRAGLRLASVGQAFLLEFPTEKSFYFRPEGEHFDSVDFSVSPVDIAREAFLPEVWSELTPRQVHLLSYDPAQQRAVLSISTEGRRSHPYRRVVVRGAPWIVEISELYNQDGQLLATTAKQGYHELDGFRFPAEVALTFPGEEAYMSFAMRKIELNAPADPALFAIESRVNALLQDGYRALTPEDFEEMTW